MKFYSILVAAFAIFSFSYSAQAESLCRKINFENAPYTICKVDPKTTGIRIRNTDRNGLNYKSFRTLEVDLRIDRTYLRFAMNGGMYHPDFSPVGLFIEQGIIKKPLNLENGEGNFFLRPNGVFYFEPGKAGVTESNDFAKSRLKPAYATQSGPMLVTKGKINSNFTPQSTSFKKRNGVGVNRNGEIIFAISEGEVRFYDFARLFRDQFNCPNALFLDGTISALRVPEWRRSDKDYPLGVIITVEDLIPG